MRDTEKLHFMREQALTLPEKGHGRVGGDYRVIQQMDRLGNAGVPIHGQEN